MEINIIGCGVMASQIAALFYLSGNKVNIWGHEGVNEEKLDKVIKLIKRTSADAVFKDGSINVISKLSDFKNNITIESVIEDLKVKKAIYEEMVNIIDKPFFTNSSSIAPLEIGDKVNGLHFFNPIFKIKLIELYLNAENSVEIDSLLSIFREFGFEIANVQNNRGYIANYIMFNEISNLFKLLEIYRYNLNDINKVYGALFNKNLFQIIDVIGVDVTYSILNNLKEKDDSIYLPKTLKDAVSKGILGKKNKTSIINFLENK